MTAAQPSAKAHTPRRSTKVAAFMPRRAILNVAKSWGRTSNALLRAVCGVTIELRGLDKIPNGALLVAAKHQSTWETFTLVTLLDVPTFILKRELTWLPVFGWYLIKARMIPIDRGAGGVALASMTEGARKAIADGYKKIAGFDPATLNARDSFDPAN